jgi:hypothetical protein
LRRGELSRDLEIEIAVLRGRMIEKDRRHAEDVRIIEQLRAENGQLRLGIGEYKGRNTELERRLALLEAPKRAQPEPEHTAEEGSTADVAPAGGKADAERSSFWRRLFGSR